MDEHKFLSEIRKEMYEALCKANKASKDNFYEAMRVYLHDISDIYDKIIDRQQKLLSITENELKELLNKQ